MLQLVVNNHFFSGGEGGRNYVLSMGQGFGISPTMKKEFHQGVMTTMVDDCQFICITQESHYAVNIVRRVFPGKTDLIVGLSNLEIMPFLT